MEQKGWPFPKKECFLPNSLWSGTWHFSCPESNWHISSAFPGSQAYPFSFWNLSHWLSTGSSLVDPPYRFWYLIAAIVKKLTPCNKPLSLFLCLHLTGSVSLESPDLANKMWMSLVIKFSVTESNRFLNIKLR